MVATQQKQIKNILRQLYSDSKSDYFKIARGFAKSIFRPIKPKDFKDVYLSISEEQGEDLTRLIQKNNIKNIVEFGTSFGISTLFLAAGVLETQGKIITTELLESKAQKALHNFKEAGVSELIELRVGDATETLKNHDTPIDLLLLDGWKDLYLTVFQMLEPNFHADTFIYVDNADMAETQVFLKTVSQNPKYRLHSLYQGKVVMINLK